MYNWEELQKWQDNLLSSLPQSPAGTAVLVDDLDMLELLATSAAAARNLVSRFLAALRTTTTTATNGASNQEGSVSHVVCFGRHPQETTAQLSSLGSGVVSASSRYLLLIKYFITFAIIQILNFHTLCIPPYSEDVGDSSGLSGPFAAVAPLSPEEEQPALCEYLRYR